MRLARIARHVLVGALALAAAEFGMRAAGVLDPTEIHDPYLGLPGTAPLFRATTAEDGTVVRRTSPNKSKNYRDQEFPERKPQDEFRVFVVGGSSIFAERLQKPDASITNMLEISLRACMPGRRPRVVNAGGGAMGSLQNLEVVREIVEYEPDLVVLYPEGGEKNLVPPMPAGVLARGDDLNPLRVDVRRVVAPFRVYVAAREAFYALMPGMGSSAFRSPFGAMLAYAITNPFGEETFTKLFEFKQDRVPVLMPDVIPAEEVERANRRFERCLREVVELCEAHSVPLVFVEPMQNLESSFYLRFHIDPGELRPGTEAEWRATYERGLELKKAGEYEAALDVLRSVRDFYVEDADEILAYYIAECDAALGRYDEQIAELLANYERRTLIRSVLEVAADEDVPLVRPYPDLVAAAGGRLPGHAWFRDSVHPLATTNRVLVRSLMRELTELGIARPLEPDDPRRVQAETRIDALVDASPPEKSVLITMAMSRGDFDEAVRIGRSIPRRELVASPVYMYYFGWALTRAGRMDEARALYDVLVSNSKANPSDLLDMSTDEALIRNAYQGDVMAIL
ncbi:MAG: hypothetical protein R3F34_16415 [Planctomycetota bacterium]